MPLLKKDKEYYLPLVSVVDAKTIDLERTLTNFLILLSFDGAPTTRARAKPLTVQGLADLACGHEKESEFHGFSDPAHQSIVYRWLESDILDLVNRGNPLKENLASARPLHLSAYRLRNPKHCRDYAASDAIFNLLRWEASDVIGALRDFFGEGLDVFTGQYDGATELDIETTLLVRLADDAPRDQKDPKKKPVQSFPLCISQARLLADDLRRLLAYRKRVPRLVMIAYLKNVMGLHLGLNTLHLFPLLPALVDQGKYPGSCARCHNATSKPEPCQDCPFRPRIVADLGDNHRTRMAELARESVQGYQRAMSRYIKAHITIKKLNEYAADLVSKGKLGAMPTSVTEILGLRRIPDDVTFDTFFERRIENLIETDDMAEADVRLMEIRRMGLPALDTYIEMVYLLRQRFQMKYHTELLDSLFQKNHESGLMRQGRGAINLRRFTIGSEMLETLVQIAVLKPSGSGFSSEPILIDEFLDFLRNRYGLFVNTLPSGTDVPPDDLVAIRANVTEFKRRLREIGFYTDLSDAYITQTIRPRFNVEAS